MIKKLFSTSVILVLALGIVVQVNGITTGLTRDPGNGAAPIVKAKWEMNPNKDSSGQYLGTDDSTDPGAQFNPSGQYQASTTITICGIVTDSDGMADIAGVYADVYYPEGIDLGPVHEAEGGGCGLLKQEDQLHSLTKAEGIELFCNRIRNNNNNLPEFNESYDYDEICSQDGELQKETAYVYCAEKDLSYEDPAGMWETVVMAQDDDSLTGALSNFFEYLPLTAFDVDFSSVNYGNVKLNTHKIVNGDLNFGTSGLPTVRNVGNTRANMKVEQDDMGLGITNGVYNVLYDGRVGSDASFTNYYPNALTTLLNPLNLSETDEMDFSIDISKFPFPPQDSYSGTMTLSADAASHLTCSE